MSFGSRMRFRTSRRTDPFWDNVVLALHMDGTQGTNNFVDVKGHAVNPIGNVHHDTTIKRFGTASGRFVPSQIDGTNDYLDIPDHPDWDLILDGNAPTMTISFFVKPDPNFAAYTSGYGFVGRQANDGLSGWSVRATTAGVPVFSPKTGELVTDIRPLPSDRFSFVECVMYRSVTASNMRIEMFIDGTLVASRFTTTSAWAENPSSPLRVGAVYTTSAGPNMTYGNLDDVLLTNGIARHQGTSWVSSPATGPNTEFITYAHNTFLAYGNFSTPQATISKSSDGINWSTVTMPSTRNWYRATCGLVDGTPRWLIQGSTATTYYYSDDLVNWTLGTYPAPLLNSENLNYFNNLFISSRYGGTEYATSSDGINWTKRDWTASNGNGYFNFAQSETRIVGIAFNGSTAIYSDTGTSWTQVALPSTQNWYHIAYGNGIFVAITLSSSVYATSPDGVVWTQRTFTSGSFVRRFVEFGNGLFFIGLSGEKTGEYSEDGITWRTCCIDRDSAHTQNSCAYGAGNFVIAQGNQLRLSGNIRTYLPPVYPFPTS